MLLWVALRIDDVIKTLVEKSDAGRKVTQNEINKGSIENHLPNDCSKLRKPNVNLSKIVLYELDRKPIGDTIVSKYKRLISSNCSNNEKKATATAPAAAAAPTFNLNPLEWL